ncbi:MAG: 4-alpha-glucanotransferase [Candidatus Zixiibacteriota bacterium]
MFISLERLAEQRLLTQRDLATTRTITGNRVDYKAALQLREQLLRKSFAAFERESAKRPVKGFQSFCRSNRNWLDDYAAFMALRRTQGNRPWTQWPAELRDRQLAAMKRMRRVVGREIRYHRYLQFQFYTQWRQLRAHARKKRICLIGDMPFYVEHDSADVWANRELFKLDANGLPTHVAGVPPDYFSRTGQLWGNPVYNWDALKKSDYAWWLLRFRMACDRFDAVRLDHFIGFHRAWSVRAGLKTAKSGRYENGPGAEFLDSMLSELGGLPFIAEDLGVVTTEVTAMREQFGLPGVRVVQFGFSDDSGRSEHLPHNFPRDCVAYTGTHDNDTAMGWFSDRGKSATTRSKQTVERERRIAMAYLGSDGKTFHWDMIRAAMMSAASITIFPMQDVLGLGTESRMNHPAHSKGNWEWRVEQSALSESVQSELGLLTRLYGRAP